MTNLKEGQILVSTWGYDQTNVDFYQITKGGEVGKFVELRKIGSNYCGSAGIDSWFVEPVLNDFRGDAIKKKVSLGIYNSPCIKLEPYAYAKLWDGKKVTATSGH